MSSIQEAPLSESIVRVTPAHDGLELYFPPLRNRGAAAGFGVFGILCIALPVAAAAGLVLVEGTGAFGRLAMVLVGGFALPLFVFGIVFIALAVYLLANSLTVTVGSDRIVAARRLFGVTLYRRALLYADIAALEPLRAARFQSRFSAEPRYQLVARSRTPGLAPLVIAESLPGRAAVAWLAARIAGPIGINLAED